MTEPYIRPLWDEYFMNIMQAVSTRATCDRGRSGCVIVRDKHILTTGTSVRRPVCRIATRSGTR